MRNMGKKNSIIIGYLIMILATVGFGMVSFTENSAVFFWLSMLMRMIQGVATSFNMTAVYSLIAFEFPE